MPYQGATGRLRNFTGQFPERDTNAAADVIATWNRLHCEQVRFGDIIQGDKVSALPAILIDHEGLAGECLAYESGSDANRRVGTRLRNAVNVKIAQHDKARLRIRQIERPNLF